ncbi:CatB-related O-acetyltransferase [Bacteroides fragilis]
MEGYPICIEIKERMFPIAHFLKGIFKNLLNPRISPFSFISANVEVDKTAYIYRGVKAKDAKIGAHSYIAANTDIENAVIGKYCSIADHCRVGMSGHSLSCLSTSPIFTQTVNALREQWIEKDVFEHKDEEETTILGNDVWVGSHVLINGGVKIGDGACIASGAVVVKDVPPYTIVGGVPAKVIRSRFPEDVIEKLEEIKWWNLPEDILKKKIGLFQKELLTVDELDGLYK